MENTTPEYHFSFEMDPVARIFMRGNHALLFIRTVDGHFLLGSKSLYPAGIYRMVGGGIEAEENPVVGAMRELQEETALTVSPDRLQKLATITMDIQSKTDAYRFITHLFFIQLVENEEQLMTGCDDVEQLKRLSLDEMNALIERYATLPTDVVDVEGDGLRPFRWSDYGKFYGKVHAIAMELSKTTFQ